jgi:hypothetical protein
VLKFLLADGGWKMLCIVRIKELSPNTKAQPTGWIIAVDADDARRQAESVGERDIAQALYRMSPEISPGKHMLAENVWLLVS